MKNIHVLLSNKPSRLLINKENTLVLTSNYYLSSNPQNIYITSDEEIKEGDWILFQGILTKALKGEKFSGKEKVVLTNDQNLIKDGVQPISDEFLEWFVKNPNCEYVEVEIDYSKSVMNYSYKIIIPEEPLYDYGWCKGNVVLPEEESKQEIRKDKFQSWNDLIEEVGSEEELIKILKLPHIALLLREAMRNNRKK